MAPLFSEEAEKAVLGMMLDKPKYIDEAMLALKPEDFYLSLHREIFQTICHVHVNGGMDIVAVKEILGAPDKRAYIAELSDYGILTLQFKKHAVAVRGHSRMRTLVKGCEVLIESAHAGEALNVCTSQLHEMLLAVEDGNEKQARHISEILRDVISEMEIQAKNDGLLGFSTGVSGLDSVTTGIRPGELWVVGALPSRGKTALGIQIGGTNIAKGIETGIFSLEMSDTKVGRRLLANYSKAGASQIREPRYLSREGWSEVHSAMGRLVEYPLWVDDVSSLNTRQLTARTRLYKRKHNLKLLVVDYLMLVDEPSERERRNKAGKIANTLRKLAKDEQIGVVLLSQLSRPSDKDLNSRPSMLSLKESGDIEAHADVVVLLYVPVDKENKPTGKDEFIVGKNREGWMGSIPVFYDRSRLRFEDRP